MNGLVDLSFTVDMVLMFMTAQPPTNGTHINDSRSYVISSYLKGWFFIDFLSVFPFEMIMVNN